MRTREQYSEIIGRVESSLKNSMYDPDGQYMENLINKFERTSSEARNLACWDWTHGIGLYGLFKLFESTKDEKHLAFIDEWFKNRICIGLPEKNVNTFAPLLVMACLYELRPNPLYENVMLEWAEWTMKYMKRTDEGGIQHIHCELENRQELWSSTLMMMGLFLAKAGIVLKRKYYLEEALYQFYIHAKYLLDTKTGLWQHAWSFLERDNLAPVLWARGNCWVMLFITEVLEIPQIGEYANRYISSMFENQVRALCGYQSASGMWHTLVNDESSYLEASASAAFCFCILKGIRKGHLDSKYKNCGIKTLESVVENIDKTGNLGQVSAGTNAGRTLEYYRGIPFRKTHYGQALALLALLEGKESEI